MGLISVSVAGCKVIVPAPSPVALSLERVQTELSSGHLALAIRELDRAWRTSPVFRPVLAHLYARLLMRQGNWPGAINLLSYGLGDCPTPDLAADLSAALHRSGQTAAAADRLDDALRRFSANPRGALARQTRAVLGNVASRYAGWAGITPTLSFYGEVLETSSRVDFELRGAADELLALKSVSANAGRAVVRFALPRMPVSQLRLTANGRPLLGGEQTFPISFAVDGRCRDDNGVIRGWARVGWNPSARPRIVIHRKAVSATGQLPGCRWEFEWERGPSTTPGGRFDVGVSLPDGTVQLLPDSPVVTRSVAVARPRKRDEAGSSLADKRGRKPTAVDIIIPCYQDRLRTAACIEAVCRTSRQAAEIIVVDDASPDPALSADLDAHAAAGRVTLLRNQKNLGFAASINRAMALHPDRDAVFVNSDVVVFDGWLARLEAIATRSADIGTVTPMADDDSIVGYTASEKDEVASARNLDRFLVANNKGGVNIELPVGVGFCLYVRRDCWRETGPFDEDVFGLGYGEEADFCMRARKLGWRHVLAPDVFVHHAGSKSFGSRRAALLERSGRLLNQRHPGYDAFVAEFLRLDPMRPVRRLLDMSRLRAFDTKIDLIVTLALSGGVDRFVSQRCRQIRAEGRMPLILQPAKLADMDECIIRSDEPLFTYLRFDVPEELSLLRGLLGSLRLHSVELHHTLGLDARVVDMVREVGPAMDVYIHDYSWVCPRVTLVDGSGSYCGEPALTKCEACIRRNGSNTPEDITVAALRRRSAQWLGAARRVIAPSEDTARRLERYLPKLRVEVEPHELFMSDAPTPSILPTPIVKVAVLGAIGHHKGYKVLLECARDAAKRQLPLDFVVIGYTENDKRLERTKRVFVTGPYSDSEVGYLIRREAPHVVFLPSVWPETWCYTLSHAIASGLPVVAFDIGAIAERLRAGQKGTLLRLGMSPRQINDRLIALGREAMRPDASIAMSSSSKQAAMENGSPTSMWNSRNG